MTNLPEISTVFIAHLSGYVSGIILYTMLLGLIFQSMQDPNRGTESNLSKSSPKWLSLWTGTLGLVWNVGGLLAFVLPQLHLTDPLPWLNIIALTALGFLPAVVILAMVDAHAMELPSWTRRAITSAGFLLSGWASVWHVKGILFAQATDNDGSVLQMMVGGFLILLGGLLAVRIWTKGWDRMGRIVVLAGIAIAALPFSQHQTGEYSWGMELIGHHANLLLALTILYQDYRFALGDLFLKRALSFLLLALFIGGVLLTVGIPTMKPEPSDDMAQVSQLTIFLALWIATALIYPYLRRSAIWLVDVVVLRRPDYEKLRQALAASINDQEEPEAILTTTTSLLQSALLATRISWREIPQERHPESESGQEQKESSWLHDALAHIRRTDPSKRPSARTKELATAIIQPIDSKCVVSILTAETPQYTMIIQGLLHGRRLLSDDIMLLEAVAHLAARRIDAVRSAHERCVITIREQEMKKLTVEAELRALRTQLNPHFLFNALTTIGYLIQATPAKALDTLMRLTELLRAVLKRLEGEFSTLGQEVDLVQSYLMIEQARFEQRLVYHIDVPSELRGYLVPALLLQPLVENAVKHGIQESSKGGVIKLVAGIQTQKSSNGNGEPTTNHLSLTVHDTGLGSNQETAAWGSGIGLSNIRKRLYLHYGEDAMMQMHRTIENGTTVYIQIPISELERFTSESPISIPSSQDVKK